MRWGGKGWLPPASYTLHGPSTHMPAEAHEAPLHSHAPFSLSLASGQTHVVSYGMGPPESRRMQAESRHVPLHSSIHAETHELVACWRISGDGGAAALLYMWADGHLQCGDACMSKCLEGVII